MKLFITTFNILLATCLFGQLELPYHHTLEDVPAWAKVMYEPTADPHEVVAEYEKYYQQHPFQLNTHTKYFKRWVRQQKRNVRTTTRSAKESQAASSQYEKYRTRLAIRQSQNNHTWEPIGPFDWDHKANGRGNTPGAAHMYVVRQSLSNPDILYAAGATCGVWKSTNHGESWQATTDGLMTGEILALDIHPTDPNTVVTEVDGKIWRTEDGGDSWMQIGASLFNSLDHFVRDIRYDPANAEKLYVATSWGLFNSIDGGDSLGIATFGETQEIEFYPGASDTIYIVKRNGFSTEFWKSEDGGQSFAQMTNGWPTNMGDQMRTEITVSRHAPNKVYALAAGSFNLASGLFGVYVSEDAGESWTFQCCGDAPGGSPTLDNQNILGSAQNGTANSTQAYYNLALTSSPTNADSIFSGGINMWVSGDGGSQFTCPSNWNQPSNPDYVHADIHDIHYNDSTLEMWVACDGGIFFSDDNGATFQRKMTGILGTDFYGYDAGFWDGEVMIGGVFHNATLIKNNDVYINGWMSADNTGDGERGFVNPGLDKVVYGDVDRKLLPDLRTAPINSTDYGHKPNVGPNTGQDSKLAFDPRSYQSWYVGDEESLWKTIDGGESFSEMHVFSRDVADIEISWANPNYIYVTTFGSIFVKKMIYRSTDGGDNWTEITIPDDQINGSNTNGYDLTVSGTDENKIWAARVTPLGAGNLDGFLVYQSNDGGDTWLNLTTADLDDEKLTNIEHQKGTEGTLYLGTTRNVYYKTDTMSSWEIFADGLPVKTYSTKLVPFYKENLIRNATNRSVWSCEMADTSNIVVMASADQLELECKNDSVQFVDHSIMRGEGAAWLWTFPNGSPSTSTLRNPKVLFNAIGGQAVTLTVSDAFGTATKTFNDMIVIRDGCGADTLAGLSLLLDGDPDHVQLPDFDRSLTHFTATAWVRLDGNQNNNSPVFMDDTQNIGLFFHQSNNTLSYRWPGKASWTSDIQVPGGEWAYVGMIVTPDSTILFANNEYEVHVDGLNMANMSSVKIGRHRDFDSRNIEGQIEEVTFWDRALTDKEVKLHRHLIRDIKSDSSIFAYYQFNEQGAEVINQVGDEIGSLAGGAQKVVSLAPIGHGTSQLIEVVSGGPQLFDTADFTLGLINSGLFPNGDVVVTRLNVAPTELPTNRALLTNGYWIVNNYGSTILNNFDYLEFLSAGFFSTEMVDITGMGRFYTRGENHDTQNWVLRESNNITLSEGLNSPVRVDPTGFNKFGQYLIVRDSFPTSESSITLQTPEVSSTMARSASSMLPGILSVNRGIILPFFTNEEIEDLAPVSSGAMVFALDRNTISYYNGVEWADIATIPITVLIDAAPVSFKGLQWTGDTTSVVSPNAVLDMSASNGYLLPPKLSQDAMLNIDHPKPGMLLYDSTSANIVYFDGARWRTFEIAALNANMGGNSTEFPVPGLVLGASQKDFNAALEVVSDHESFFIPSAKAAQMAQPSQGLLIFDLDLRAFLVYDGLRWKQLL